MLYYNNAVQVFLCWPCRLCSDRRPCRSLTTAGSSCTRRYMVVVVVVEQPVEEEEEGGCRAEEGDVASKWENSRR